MEEFTPPLPHMHKPRLWVQKLGTAGQGKNDIRPLPSLMGGLSGIPAKTRFVLFAYTSSFVDPRIPTRPHLPPVPLSPGFV